MASDTEEYEAAVQLVWNAHSDLKKLNQSNPLLNLIESAPLGFRPTDSYNKKYLEPHLQNSTLFQARMLGLLEFRRDLVDAIKSEISERGLDRIVRTYR